MVMVEVTDEGIENNKRISSLKGQQIYQPKGTNNIICTFYRIFFNCPLTSESSDAMLLIIY